MRIDSAFNFSDIKFPIVFFSLRLSQLYTYTHKTNTYTHVYTFIYKYIYFLYLYNIANCFFFFPITCPLLIRILQILPPSHISFFYFTSPYLYKHFHVFISTYTYICPYKHHHTFIHAFSNVIWRELNLYLFDRHLSGLFHIH